MDATTVLQELESLGTAQNRKVYPRHGVTGPLFGVSYANLAKLKKKIGSDHALALALWQSGYHDARVLATMVADPAQADAKLLDAWIKDIDNYVLADAFSGLASQSELALARTEKWTASKGEWVGSVGWSVLARRAQTDGGLTDGECERYLGAIEQRIHKAKNRARYAMNNALIAIGVRSERLEAQALGVAARVGVVHVDHGETGCKTPDAASYIRKTSEYRRKKKKTTRKKKAKTAKQSSKR